MEGILKSIIVVGLLAIIVSCSNSGSNKERTERARVERKINVDDHKEYNVGDTIWYQSTDGKWKLSIYRKSGTPSDAFEKFGSELRLFYCIEIKPISKNVEGLKLIEPPSGRSGRKSLTALIQGENISSNSDLYLIQTPKHIEFAFSTEAFNGFDGTFNIYIGWKESNTNISQPILQKTFLSFKNIESESVELQVELLEVDNSLPVSDDSWFKSIGHGAGLTKKLKL